uniref:Uncharacterized protein n=1 Tax=Nelumbo nucifera TaxID=4432 RepID=A0A822YET0_NELNU|nr:TPA_asm: hypothetical protein HUJ06_011525 [Nelumbo nucifera]
MERGVVRTQGIEDDKFGLWGISRCCRRKRTTMNNAPFSADWWRGERHHRPYSVLRSGRWTIEILGISFEPTENSKTRDLRSKKKKS